MKLLRTYSCWGKRDSAAKTEMKKQSPESPGCVLKVLGLYGSFIHKDQSRYKSQLRNPSRCEAEDRRGVIITLRVGYVAKRIFCALLSSRAGPALSRLI